MGRGATDGSHKSVSYKAADLKHTTVAILEMAEGAAVHIRQCKCFKYVKGSNLDVAVNAQHFFQ